jgi:mRNA interferase MazF
MDVVRWPRRFEIWLVGLDPTIGAEMRKTRSCVVVSPDEMNRFIRTVIVAPMTSADRPYPSRVPIVSGGRTGSVALDQLRTVDKNRLLKHLGTCDAPTAERICEALLRMFRFSND